MTDNIKLPPMPRPQLEKAGWTFYDDSDMEAYAREAVRLNAQATSMQWPKPEDVTPEMLNAFRSAYKEGDFWRARIHGALCAMLSAAPAAPAPRKIEIPPPGADALDVAFAEGWNQCCDAYFGGLPPQAPLVVTVLKTNSDTAEAAPQPAQQPLTVPDGFVPQICPHCNETWLMEAQQTLTDEKDALLRQALEALEGFVHITTDSQGVAGYHLSGDTAEWDEFDEVDAASNTIEAIRTHLGVEP